MSSDLDVEKCLICFQNNKIMISLLEVLTGYEFSVAQVLSDLNFLTISDEANLRRALCFRCVAKVQMCFEFKTLCSQIESLLKIQSNGQVSVYTTALPIISSVVSLRDEPTWDSDVEEIVDEDPIYSCDAQLSNVANIQMNMFHSEPKITEQPKKNVPIYSDSSDCNFDDTEKNDDIVFVKEEKWFEEISTENGDFGKPSEETIHENSNDCTLEYTLSNTEVTEQLAVASSSSDGNIFRRILRSKREISFQSQRNIKKKSKRKRSGFQQHLLDRNSGKYVCKLCNKTFNRVNHLAIHRIAHSCSKVHVCDVCNKTFTRAAHLAVHKKMHTGGTLHICNVCNKNFSTTSNLNVHKLIHTGIKPYKCDYCSKEFTQAGNLRSHLLIHTGEKPFKCEFCYKSFTTARSRKLHMFTQHTKNK